jgi:pimeloyl-ACP methyl ester carboxylesterase
MYPAGERRINVRYVTLADGTRVRVLESVPEQRDTVLLVHGWGASAYSFAETIPAIAAAGYQAIAFDLPGCGLSDKPRNPAKYTTSALTDAVLGVADALGLKRFCLVGHSLGGSLGLELAMRGEKRLDRLILISPPTLGRVPIVPIVKLFSPRLVDRITPRVLTRGLVTLVLRAVFGTPQRPTTRDIEEYWAPSQFDDFAWACRQTLHSVTWKRLPATKLRSLRLPVLVIIGGRDRFVRAAAKRARLIPTAQVVLIPEGGHVVMQECATKVNAKLLLFLPGGRGRR